MIVKEDERLMDSYNQAKAKALQIGKTADTLYDEKRIEMIAKDFLAALEAEDKAMLISQPVSYTHLALLHRFPHGRQQLRDLRKMVKVLVCLYKLFLIIFMPCLRF